MTLLEETKNSTSTTLRMSVSSLYSAAHYRRFMEFFKDAILSAMDSTYVLIYERIQVQTV